LWKKSDGQKKLFCQKKEFTHLFLMQIFMKLLVCTPEGVKQQSRGLSAAQPSEYLMVVENPEGVQQEWEPTCRNDSSEFGGRSFS